MDVSDVVSWIRVKVAVIEAVYRVLVDASQPLEHVSESHTGPLGVGNGALIPGGSVCPGQLGHFSPAIATALNGGDHAVNGKRALQLFNCY